MKRIGKTNAIAAAISRLWSATATRKRLRRTERGTSRRGGAEGGANGTAGGEVVLISATRRVVDPAPRVAHDRQRDRERDDEQQHRHRGGVAHVEEAEALLEQQHGIEQRRVLWVAEVVGRIAGAGGGARRDRRPDVGLVEDL